MKKQRGIGFWGIIWGGAFVVCITVVAVKTIPVYLDNQKIARALEQLLEEPNVMTMKKRSLISAMEKDLYIDFLDNVVDLNRAFAITKVNNGRQFSVNYEVVVPLVGNANLLFDFKNSVVATNNP